MRPLRLDVEGFTCYRERQQPLDFSSLSLFAIAGPTGAGKSSILDTMLYALYGEVPRIGKHGIGEFISHGRDAMSVCLEFRVSGKDYRVTRRVKRVTNGSLKTTVTLAEVAGGLEKSLADGVKPVNDTVVGLLGLGYDEFIQTVVLPQGDFAKFLKAKPTEQRAILQHLLRHDVFTRMRDTAEERRKALSGKLDVLDGKLSTYAEATAEALAEREGALAEARAQLQSATAARDAADAALKEAQRLHGLTQEVTRLRGQQESLDQQAPAVERARAELAQARRARPVVPYLEAVNRAASRAVEARRALDEAATAATLSAEARRAAAKTAAAATAAASECEALDRLVQALDEIAGDVSQRGALTTALAGVPAKLAAAGREETAARKSEAAAEAKVAQARSALKALQAAHDAVAFDESIFAKVEFAHARVGEARALQLEVTTLAAEAATAAAAGAAAQRDEQVAEAALEAARQRAEAAARELEAATAALEAGRVRHSASVLQAHLHAGDNCPVCLQAVDEPPKVQAAPELSALEQTARHLAEHEKKAARGREAASNTHATASARLAAAVAAAQAVAAKLQSRNAALTSLLTSVAAAVPEFADGSPSGTSAEAAVKRGRRASAAVASPDTALIDWIEQRHTELRAAKHERERHAQALHKAAADLSGAMLASAHAAADARAALARHEQCVAEQARLQADLAVVVDRIRAVTSSDDPRAERQALAQRAAQLRAAERSAAEAVKKEDLQATMAGERRQAAEATLAQAAADMTAAQAQLARALAEAGFATDPSSQSPNPDQVGGASVADQVKAAIRTTLQETALDTQVTTFDQQRAGIGYRLAEIEPLVTGREVSAEALADAERGRKAAMDAWQAVNQQVTTLTSDVARLQKDVKARAALLAEREALQATLAITAEMATDLRGDRFQEYLLEEAFTGLVTGASVRMREISNRYTLEWAESEFHVVDHDNAGERRRADTLSGGETFMASLCLALQLSETVLQASGALQMDSLFIDEGFGTLDAESLSEVTDAIEALGQNGDRLIGVISHRAELTDRMPGCIRIDKGAGESRWVMERAG